MADTPVNNNKNSTQGAAASSARVDVKVDEILDVTGLNCPMPLLKAKLKLNGLNAGTVLEVRATDAGSVRDFEVFCSQSQHELLGQWQDDEVYHHLLRCG